MGRKHKGTETQRLGSERSRAASIAITLLLVLIGCRSENTNPTETLKAFLDEFYAGRAQSDMTPLVDKYTEWPDFAVGNTVQIATDRDLRLVTENGEEATFEVRYKVVGEESLGKVEVGETEVVQTYRLRRRRGQWRILQPINIPCISVTGEVNRLRAAHENASNQLAKNDSTAAPREQLESFIANAHASIELLERYN